MFWVAVCENTLKARRRKSTAIRYWVKVLFMNNKLFRVKNNKLFINKFSAPKLNPIPVHVYMYVPFHSCGIHMGTDNSRSNLGTNATYCERAYLSHILAIVKPPSP